MGIAFKSFFSFLAMLFSGAERAASAVNHLATWADESSAQFADKARHDRQMELARMLAEAGLEELPKAKPMVSIATLTPVVQAPAVV